MNTNTKWEQMLLAHLLRTGNPSRAKLQTITADTFSEERNKHIWRAIVGVERVNADAVKQWLENEGRGSEGAYIDELAAMTVTAEFLTVASELTRLHGLRVLDDALERARVALAKPNANPEEMFFAVIGAIEKRRPVGVKKSSYTSEEADADLEAAIRGDNITVGRSVEMPWKSLWYMGYGFQRVRPGQMFAIAGIEGSNKTTFAVRVADHALRQGHSVLFWSPEWDQVEFHAKMLYLHGGVHPERFVDHIDALATIRIGKPATTAQLTKEEIAQHNAARARMAAAHAGTLIHVKTPMPIEGIEREILIANSKLAEQGKPPIGLVLIDYIQIMESRKAEKRSNEYEANNARMMQIEAMASTHGFAVVIASQTTKEFGKEPAKGRAVRNVMHAERTWTAKAMLFMDIVYDTGGKETPLRKITIGKQNRGGGSGGYDYLYFHKDTGNLLDRAEAKAIGIELPEPNTEPVHAPALNAMSKPTRQQEKAYEKYDKEVAEPIPW